MGIMCRVGLHKWIYTKPIYGSEANRRRGIFIKAEQRRCFNCGKKQVKRVYKSKKETVATWLNCR